MRDAFFAELEGVVEQDPRLIFITADLGYKLFDPLKRIASKRVINIGIREAGMVGFAAGLARTGMLPIIYSIVPFMTLRCLEQIKIDLCYNKARAVLVGVGGGFAYGTNGPTHHGIDDLGVLSCLPGMTIWTPADPIEVRACVRSILQLEGPAYLRLGRNKEPNIHDSEHNMPDIANPLVLKEGQDGTIVTCGFIVTEVKKAIEILNQEAIYPRLIQITTLRPFPTEYFCQLFADGKPVMTVEEHILTGGIGLETAAILAKMGRGNPFQMLSIPMEFPPWCMDRKALLEWAGLSANTISEQYTKLFLTSCKVY